MEAATATQLRQLSFEVGGDPAERLEGSISISGKLEVRRDLDRDETLEVKVLGPGGELIAHADAVVSKVSFNTQRKQDEPAWTERAHTAKIEGVE